MPTNRNYPDAPPIWPDKDPSPYRGPASTDGGTLDTPPDLGTPPPTDGDDD